MPTLPTYDVGDREFGKLAPAIKKNSGRIVEAHLDGDTGEVVVNIPTHGGERKQVLNELAKVNAHYVWMKTSERLKAKLAARRATK